MLSLHAHRDIFDANRAVARLFVSVAADGMRTRRRRISEEGPLRARFPNAEAAECEAVIVNTAGGIAGGDRFDIAVDVGEGARLSVCAAAAEKIYRTHGPDSEIALRLRVADGAALRWLPQETILFDCAQVTRTIDIDLAGSASVVAAESIVFGRSAMGERMETGKLSDRWRVRHDGRLVFAETLKLGGRIADTLACKAVAADAAAIATVLVAPADESLAAAIRAVDGGFAGEVGVSAWNGLAIVRLCAREGAMLRRDLVAVLGTLGKGALPRLWMN